jgi:hypothetical protein
VCHSSYCFVLYVQRVFLDESLGSETILSVDLLSAGTVGEEADSGVLAARL